MDHQPIALDGMREQTGAEGSPGIVFKLDRTLAPPAPEEFEAVLRSPPGRHHIGARDRLQIDHERRIRGRVDNGIVDPTFVRSEEHTSELQSLMRTSYAVFCLKTTNISR